MNNRNLRSCRALEGLLTAGALMFIGCTPKIELEAPDKPITINLNVKIEHDVRVKIDKQLEDQVFTKDSKLF